MIISSALCALSLRAILSNRRPHLSEDEIRLHHARCRRRTPSISGSGPRVRVFECPVPPTVSLAAMSRYFESRCTPQDFCEAKSDRDFNNRLRREFGAKDVTHA